MYQLTHAMQCCSHISLFLTSQMLLQSNLRRVRIKNRFWQLFSMNKAGILSIAPPSLYLANTQAVLEASSKG
jgi:predicted ATP-dependent serine protease